MNQSESEPLIELQTKIAYLEDLIESLNEVICEHEKRVDSLERVSKHLYDKLESAQQAQNNQGTSDSMGHEVPPHY
ncbi:MAG: SlyX family protein [Gammaproteobacteria bacterium]|nr:SlyX family protein [Gammaproteobacteria bacterium]